MIAKSLILSSRSIASVRELLEPLGQHRIEVSLGSQPRKERPVWAGPDIHSPASLKRALGLTIDGKHRLATIAQLESDTGVTRNQERTPDVQMRSHRGHEQIRGLRIHDRAARGQGVSRRSGRGGDYDPVRGLNRVLESIHQDRYSNGAGAAPARQDNLVER